MPKPPDRPDDAAPAASEADLGAVELRVSFRAGEVLMTLDDLRALAPGAIVETTAPADAVVAILVNGAPVGTGELIEVSGRRAVEVREIHGTPRPAPEGDRGEG